jgi:hypothetical protein
VSEIKIKPFKASVSWDSDKDTWSFDWPINTKLQNDLDRSCSASEGVVIITERHTIRDILRWLIEENSYDEVYTQLEDLNGG